MEQDERPETVTAVPRVLVSYDVRRGGSVESGLVNQFIFDRKVTVRTKGGVRKYRYQGLISRPGVERTVCSLDERERHRGPDVLSRELRVPYTAEPIWVRA